MKYKLCEAAGLTIISQYPEIDVVDYMIPARDVEAMLEQAPVVGFKSDNISKELQRDYAFVIGSPGNKEHTHQARLLLIEPIRKGVTKEQILWALREASSKQMEQLADMIEREGIV